MAKIKNINLEFSCPRNRGTLNKSGRTYSCDQCQHQVTDFTNSSSQELIKAIQKLEKPVCGIFKKSQLSEQFIKYAAATFIATTSLTTQVRGQIPAEVDPAEQTCKHLDEHEDTDEFFGMVIEKQAEPIGGYAKFFEAISRELEYPKGLDKPGRTFIQFTVDTLGHMTGITVFKGLHELADKEALRVLRKIDYSFKPGEQRGKKIKTRMVIPITFELNNKKEK